MVSAVRAFSPVDAELALARWRECDSFLARRRAFMLKGKKTLGFRNLSIGSGSKT